LAIDEIRFDAGLQQDVTAAIWQPHVEAEALSLVNPLFDAELLPSRKQILRLLRWAPIIEHVAYRYFTHACMFVDQLRTALLVAIDEPSPDREIALLGYWSQRSGQRRPDRCRGSVVIQRLFGRHSC